MRSRLTILALATLLAAPACGTGPCRGAGCPASSDAVSDTDTDTDTVSGTVSDTDTASDTESPALPCAPGALACQGEETVLRCNAEGTAWEFSEDCDGRNTARVCYEGLCTRLCELAFKFPAYMGCEYWAVDLDNAFVSCSDWPSGICDAQNAPFAVVVSNPHPRWPAEIAIHRWDEASGAEVPVTEDRYGDPLPTSDLEPGELRVYFLAGGDLNGTMRGRKAFRVSSDLPVTAYQFNPLDNVQVFSNDASLLLPSSGLGGYYYVLSREQTYENLRSYVAIVATTAGTTNVSVRVAAGTQPNTTQDLPHLEAGDTYDVQLARYEVLNLETDALGADMTGTRVFADRPIVVFGGSEASDVPNDDGCIANPDWEPGSNAPERVCKWDGRTACEDVGDCSMYITHYADHLEEQLFPVKTWGKRYVATRSARRGNEADTWRVIAASDDTRITTVPPQDTTPVLQEGEWVEFESDLDFELHATRPVMLGQYLQGHEAPGPGEQEGDALIGDPALILATPVEQFRSEYVFLAPDKYELDYLNVLAPASAEVTLDDEVLLEIDFDVVGTGDYKVARVPIEDGVHRVTASEPIGLVVYGYDHRVSYGYAAGLNLTDLNDEPGM